MKKLSLSATDALLNSRLRKFLAIYERSNIHKAAEDLRISQPALTVALKQLEESFGEPLFERSVQGMTPTPAGDLLYRYACSIRQTARLAIESFVEARDGVTRKLRVGAGVAWTTTVLPSALTQLRSNYPGLSVDLLAGVGDQLASLYRKGEIDLFISAGPMVQHDLTDVHRKHLTNLQMIAVADRENPLAQKAKVTAGDLVAMEWAGFYEDESFVHLSNHYMSIRGLPPPRIVMRTNSVAALQAFVRDSGMISILVSPLADATQREGFVQLPLAEPLWNVPMNIFVRKTVYDLPVVSHFIGLIEQQMKHYSN
ncbi:LysR family transcriptional regulator [uncultured Cohaesibacter sp.]|uniref:LysR family transcriptional regulator n=1 Tax=uncultured Cohaesibacter sp. TaxID=1002546 RepID=UPI0029C80152|nr:LysR family transcriptional regulator [uncultured Cohaesibacter sp.]